AWVDFKNFSVHKATASLKCNDLVLYYLGEDVESWALDHISMKFQWSQAGNDSIISVNDLYVRRNNRGWPQKTAASLKISDGHEIGFKANYVRLDDFIYFKKIIDVLRPNYELDQIALIDMDTVKADLYDVDVELNINEPEDLLVKGYFREFGYQSKSKIPSINGLDGYVRYDQGRMVFDLSSDGVSLDFNGLFRNKLHLDYLSGEVSVGRRDNDWLVTSDKIIAQSEHLGSDVRMKITIPEQGEVFMDIVSSLYNGDARYVNLYLPASIMNKKTVKWLDEAFVRADIPRGGFLYYGRVDHFPFKNGEGVMEILFDVENAKLKYLHGWPEITNLKSSALFYNSSFSIQGATGHVYGSDLTNVNIAIDDFSDAHLSIGGNISSPLSDMLLFVNNSPLKDMLGDFVAGLEGKGQAGLDLNLEIPLVSDAKLKVNGDLLFKNNNINLPDQGYLLENVTGQLAFTESSIRSDQLQATLNKHMIQIDIESRDHGQKPETLISVAGGLPVKSVLSPVPFLTNYFDGVADWLANIRIPMGGGRQQPKVSIDVKSELLGVSSSLPVPFAKKTDKPVSLDLKINVMHDNTVNLTMLYDSSIRYSAKYDNQLWDMGLISPQLRGSIRFSGKSILDHPVSLKINYLDATAYSSLKTGDSKIKISPANLPSLTVTAKEIVWNKMQFRNVRLKTHPDKSGMIIDQLDLDGPDIQLKGKGSWLTTWRYENRTVLDFSLTTGNLGRCLHELNLSKSIKDADGRGDFKLAWNAEPYNVSLDLIEGESNIKLEDGELVDIKPGAGRILGILNFETLLSLDFGNQVSGGFSFDEIKGSLRFENGNVYTDDMIIEGKVAEINMQGRVGLVAKDFDQ
ncbi:MAG: DUF3971 domain-containing protein, partial [Gammaproteobacteria bacterium]|nr:DUF3971 domain-containing protein [Gammaproteobacteria bacterium]